MQDRPTAGGFGIRMMALAPGKNFNLIIKWIKVCCGVFGAQPKMNVHGKMKHPFSGLRRTEEAQIDFTGC